MSKFYTYRWEKHQNLFLKSHYPRQQHYGLAELGPSPEGLLIPRRWDPGAASTQGGMKCLFTVQDTGWEKILANHRSEIGCMFRTYKELLKFNHEKKKSIKTGQADFFPKMIHGGKEPH